MADREYLKQLISAYIDDETTDEESQLVEEALAKDAELKKYYQELQELSKTLQSWSNEKPSPDLEQKMNKAWQQAQVKEGTLMEKKTGMRMSTVATVAVVVIVSVVGMQTYSQRTIQGRIRDASIYLQSRTGVGVQDIGEQYSPGNTNVVKLRQSSGATQVQYEPYYLKTNYPNAAATITAPATAMYRMEEKGMSVRGGFQQSSYDTSMGLIAGLGGEAEVSQHGVSTSTLNEDEVIVPVLPLTTQTDWNTEQYNRIYDNAFLEVAQNPLSTFSIDVDTASYSNLRRFLNDNQMPPPDSVRIEEMINYFSYDYPEPEGEHPFSVTTEVTTCPWNTNHQIALIGLQGKRLQTSQMPPSNLVFLIDVSGSMDEPNKLPLLKSALQMMTQQLRAEDKISIVVYAGAAGEVLDPTPGDQKQKILNAIEQLQAGGCTAGAAGIQLAYENAKRNFVKDGNNRVILATDGDFNVGVSSDGDLIRIIEEKRKNGIFLTVLGFGTGNFKDSKMEQLADKGNGNYYYIDTIKEAKKVLVQELGSTLFTIAKDVKLQIEFNPGQIKAYRLIGYENRVMAKEDFNDDTKDAGELGTGHSVTALYELVPADSTENFSKVDDLRYQNTQVKISDDLFIVKLRYKKPDEDTSKLLDKVVNKNEVVSQPGNNLSWAESVAEFGLVLRNSEHKGKSTYADALLRATASRGEDPWGFRQELIDLIKTAEAIDTRYLVTGGGIGTK